MLRSGSKLSSPQRTSSSTQGYAGPDLDSPSRQKIKLLADKWNSISSGVERDKVEKKDLLEERIVVIEAHVAEVRPKDEQRFKIMKDQVVKLQDFVIADQHERETFDQKRDADLKSLGENLVVAFEAERTIKVNNDARLMKQTDEKFVQFSLTSARNNHIYEDKTAIRLNEVRQQAQNIKNQIETERRAREESSESISEQVEDEITRFQDQLIIEKKVREETQTKIFRMIEDTHSQLHQEIQTEKKERQSTVDALLKLLEDACIKIDKNFRL